MEGPERGGREGVGLGSLGDGGVELGFVRCYSVKNSGASVTVPVHLGIASGRLAPC